MQQCILTSDNKGLSEHEGKAMASELTVATDSHLSALVTELGERAKGYAEAAKAANTL